MRGSIAVMIALGAAAARPARAEPRVVTLTLTSRAAAPREVVREIAVPRGMRITAMRVTIDARELDAVALPAGAARDRYRDELARARDPALLELGPGGAVLRVFPVARDRPAVVAITLAPDDTAAPRLFFEPPPDPGLDAATSLVAAPPPARRVPRVIVDPIGEPAYVVETATSSEIREVVRLHHPQLRRCYMEVAQRDRSLAGTAVLHFTVAASGDVAGASVDGELRDDRVRTCLAAAVAGWRFPGGGGVVVVNYPIRFQLADAPTP